MYWVSPFGPLNCIVRANSSHEGSELSVLQFSPLKLVHRLAFINYAND